MGTSTQNTTSSNNSSTVPWDVQAGYLKQAFQGANNALGTANNNAAGTQPSGFTAQYTPAMMQAFQQELGYGTGNSNIPGSSAAAGTALTGAGSDAAQKGLFGLANFTPQGGTQSNIDAATQYANAGSGAIPGMVAGAMRDANQEYTDQTAPAIQRNAAGTGNINSTAPSIQQGIVQRGLAQKAGDISANLQGGLYTHGLDLAQQGSQSNNANNLTALMGAASGGTSAAGTGVGANSGAVNQQTGLFNIANGGAANLNAGDQANLTNQLQAYNFGQNSPFTALNNFMSLIGNKAWGSNTTGSGTSNTASTPSPLSMIGSGLGMVGSFF